MYRNYETKHIFMTIGFCIALLCPFIIMLAPHIVAETLHSNQNLWIVQAPSVNYYLYAIGFLLLIASCLLLYFMDARKNAILPSVICTLLSVIPFYIAAQSYKSLSEESISFRNAYSLSDRNYTWDQVKSITHYVGNEGDSSEFTFLFQDGQSMELSENGYTDQILGQFYSLCRTYNLKIKQINKS
ncbi:hypothetical protein [Bacillus sp. 1P06AnD]|uniref:hypothetical protein n=1 Tax=Bacillus sp. 1P06AnD TaxID=3132208 RepID=UPI0039A0FE86